MATKSAKKKRMTTKRRTRRDKAEDRAVKEYADKYQAWSDEAHKVLAAKKLMELVGGYKEAFVLLDAVMDAKYGETNTRVRQSEGKVDDPPKEYGEKMEACEETVCKVMAAERLIQLAGEPPFNAFLLLDAVMIAVEGAQGHEQGAEVNSSAARHHEALAAAAEEGCK